MIDKAYFMMSLCMKAGKIVSGSDTVEKAIQKGEAVLVIIAEDSSENTKKKFINKSKYYKTDCIVVSTKEQLSRVTGKCNQAVFAVKDKGFADNIKKNFEEK